MQAYGISVILYFQRVHRIITAIIRQNPKFLLKRVLKHAHRCLNSLRQVIFLNLKKIAHSFQRPLKVNFYKIQLVPTFLKPL